MNNTLQKLIDEYIEVYCLLEDGQNPDTTVYRKRHTFNRFVKFTNNKIPNIKTINAYRTHLLDNGWASRSVHHELRVIKAWINWLNKTHKGILDFEGSDIHLPRLKRINYDLIPIELAEKVVITGTTLGKYDKSTIHKQSKSDSRVAMLLSLYTGLRAVEILRLRGEDLNIENKTFLIRSKGGHEDLAPLPEALVEPLKHRKHRERVFYCSRKAMNNHLKNGLKRLGIDKQITLHSLRRIFATDLANRGAPTHDISQAMRHSDIRITWDNYIRLNTEHQRKTMQKYHTLARKSRSTKQKIEDVISTVKEMGEIIEQKTEKNDVVFRLRIS